MHLQTNKKAKIRRTKMQIQKDKKACKNRNWLFSFSQDFDPTCGQTAPPMYDQIRPFQGGHGKPDYSGVGHRFVLT
jgi:hypothetical protein